jgi:GNAT superfamily N-acetyltransferase
LKTGTMPEDVRRIALSLPQASESSHMGQPDFRVAGKIFATLSAGKGLAMAKLRPEQQEVLCAAEPDIFVPVPGGWGRRGSTHVRLAAADEPTLRSALLMAWRNVAPRPLIAELDAAAKTPGRAATRQDGAVSAKAPPLRLRRAKPEEAAAISAMILRTVRQTNAADYEPALIEGLAADLTESEVARHMRERLVHVAVSGGEIVGTASLSGERVNSVFVEPSHQGRGIGLKMMRFIEALASRQGREHLCLSSSLTALNFYRRLGYEGDTRQLKHGVETVLVRKVLRRRRAPGRA